VNTDRVVDLDRLLHYFHSLIFAAKPTEEVPECISDNRKAEEIAITLMETRRALSMAMRGDFSYKVASKGFLAGSLKGLQANLNHLSWMAQRISEGDLQQRVAFLGDFSDVFNSMVEQLAVTLGKLREEEKRWQLVMLCTRDGVWEVNLNLKTTPYYSPHLFGLLGLSPDYTPSVTDWPRLFHPDDHELMALYKRFVYWNDPPQAFEIDHKLLCADGTYRWFFTRGMVLYDPENKKPLRIIGVLADIQDRKEREELYSYRSTHDVLTDLANRLLFDEHLKNGIALAKRARSHVAVVMVDLDKFKYINDTYGHHVGDIVLIEVASRLQKSLRQSDMASRFGGDEFAMILAFGENELQAITKVLKRAMLALKKPILVDETKIFITASFGVSVYPEDGEIPRMLMTRADEAMYHAKALGRNVCVFWKCNNNYTVMRCEKE